MEMVFRAVRVKFLFLFFLVIIISKSSYGQLYDHYTFRPSLQIQKKITSDLEINIEYQNRRQRGFQTNGENLNIFRLPYQESWRLWLIKQVEPERYGQDRKAELTLSPFAYFRKWQLQGKPGDELRTERREIRFTAMGEVFQYFRHFRIQNRTGYEYRIFFEDNGNEIRGRIRNRIQGQVKIAGNFRFNLQNEFFLHVPPNAGPNYFNENRTGGTIVYRTEMFRVEGGYIFIYNPRSSLIETDRENGVVLNLTIYF
jgi:hypothetical protein